MGMVKKQYFFEKKMTHIVSYRIVEFNFVHLHALKIEDINIIFNVCHNVMLKIIIYFF